MTKISLLPPELKLQRRNRRRKALMVLTGVIMLSIFIFINAAFTLAIRSVENDHNLVKEQHQQIRQKIEALEEYEEMQERANTVERILDEALGTEPDWHELLLSLGIDFPTGMQLTNLSASYAEDKGELFLMGSARDYNEVINWIEKLRGMPQLKEIEYLFDIDKGLNLTKKVQFQITATLQPGKPAGGRKELPAT